MMPFISTFIYFIAAIIIVLIGLVIFEWLTTKYKDWDEIKAGNQAIALSIAGKIIGICIILAFAIYNSITVWETLIWGAYGVILQMIAYLLFELVTRKFSVEQQLKEKNIAVGIISLGVSVGLAFVIGASIT
jgi:putative membrane protein